MNEFGVKVPKCISLSGRCSSQVYEDHVCVSLCLSFKASMFVCVISKTFSY